MTSLRKPTGLIGLVLAIAGICMLCATTIFLSRLWRVPERPLYVATASASIAVGDLRSDAVTRIATNAWFHGECTRGIPDVIFDAFLYGSHEPGEVQVLLVRSRDTSDGYLVDFIGTIPDEQLFLFEDCLPAELVGKLND